MTTSTTAHAGKLVVVHGGELAKDVAERIASQALSSSSSSSAPVVSVVLRSASSRPKELVDVCRDRTVVGVVFVMQTVENAEPTEDGGSCMRFFQRRTHPENLLTNSGFRFAVLGLGDSNLLLDRQTTDANDCNQVAKKLDCRLESLGGSRLFELGLADERTGLQEVEPWILGLWRSVEAAARAAADDGAS